MPGGPTEIGIVYFSAVKLVGYSAAGLYLNRVEHTTRPHPLAFGVVRTVVGIAAGISYAFLLSGFAISNQEITFYAGLIPIRIIEWLVLLWLFYRGAENIETKRWKYVVLGVLWSYALDLPAVFAAFVLPGGFWIC